MVYVKDWEDFEIAAESMFMQNPGNCRFTLKYIHSKGLIQLKFTDNVKCIQYKTEIMPDLKKIEKLTGNLMLHMASNN
ncbi:signal recognition particle 9 kDa protein [Sitodiplosis mosellana]|uniref:signal recognition particle 9 kDa protein n=1 Tax=Sitodiplosis mosellana TaxID=263140 RepID=UPI002444DC65|nr:signal recognition particle 9 kDa protein [Sitodiplosis mosellana]